MSRSLVAALLSVVLVIAAAMILSPRMSHRSKPERFGFGRLATAAEIRDAKTEVTPDGAGLPHGSGTVAQGETIYAARCASCHGVMGTEGPFDRLVGRVPGDSFNFARDPKLLATRTIGNYWPYATTLYDYIHRAMPFDAPGSLGTDEIYGVVAYLLYRNQIIGSSDVMNELTVPQVRMPARGRFVADNRNGGRVVR